MFGAGTNRESRHDQEDRWASFEAEAMPTFDGKLVAQIRISDFTKLSALHLQVSFNRSTKRAAARSRAHAHNRRAPFAAVSGHVKCATSPGTLIAAAISLYDMSSMSASMTTSTCDLCCFRPAGRREPGFNAYSRAPRLQTHQRERTHKLNAVLQTLAKCVQRQQGAL